MFHQSMDTPTLGFCTYPFWGVDLPFGVNSGVNLPPRVLPHLGVNFTPRFTLGGVVFTPAGSGELPADGVTLPLPYGGVKVTPHCFTPPCLGFKGVKR